MKENGFKVINTHIENGGNFFEIDPKSIKFDCIVSNPPFSLKDEILEKLYEIGNRSPYCFHKMRCNQSSEPICLLKTGLNIWALTKGLVFTQTTNSKKLNSEIILLRLISAEIFFRKI